MTVLDATDTIQEMHLALDSLLDDLTHDYFKEPYSNRTHYAAKRMLELAPMLWDTPKEFIETCVYECLAVDDDGAPLENPVVAPYFRPGALAVAEAVTESTTWEEFTKAVWRNLPDLLLNKKGRPY